MLLEVEERRLKPARFDNLEEAKGRMSRWQAGIFWLLATVVLLSPLPLGGDRPLPASVLFAAIGALVLAWGIAASTRGSGPAVPIAPLLPAGVLFVGTVAWAVAQASSFTPESLHHPDWAAARSVLKVPVAGAVSVNPEATWTRVQGLLAYGGVFWLAVQLCARPARARQAMLALAAAGLAYAAYGLYANVARPGPVTSTFVNRNSYATYAGMTLFCGLSLLVQRVARYGRGDVPVGRALVRMLSQLDLATTTAMLSFLACSMALLLTQSRGAFVAVAIAFLLYLWLLRSTANLRSRAFYLGFVIVMLATAASLVRYSGEETLQRLGQAGANFHDRLLYYETTWNAIEDRPLLGTGYGTFADAFTAYNRPETGTYFLDKAHNTYLQLVLELGWPAALALFAAIGCLVYRCWQGARGGRESLYPATVLACSVLVGVQALVDFSMEMPANALTYALLLGIGCAQAGAHRRSRTGGPAGAAGRVHFAWMTPRMASSSSERTTGAAARAARMMSVEPASRASRTTSSGASRQISWS